MISPTKATKLLKDYRENNFNAKKTLIQNGYSEKTAIKNAGRTLETANQAVKRALKLPDDTDIEQTSGVLDIVGFTREDVIKELIKVINQDRDLTNKLKAMKPLLDSINYHLEDDKQLSQPSVNITIDKIEPNMAQHSPDTENPHQVIDVVS